MIRAIKTMVTIKYIMANIFVFNANHILLLFNQLIQIEKEDSQFNPLSVKIVDFNGKRYGRYLVGLG
jgi:hypothetical protein